MPLFQCPLCKQEVSKTIYEELTGIWKERVKRLEALRVKEKQLAKKTKELTSKFSKEKQELAKKFQTDLNRRLGGQERKFAQMLQLQKKKLESDKKKVEEHFDRKLLATSKKILQEERKKHSQHLKDIESRLKSSSDIKIKKERAKISKEKQAFEKQQRRQKDHNLKVLKQYQTLQSKSQKQLAGADKKIKSLEEQLEKNKTPQMLGLLNEIEFLAELKRLFPEDKFKHTGKGGDILHYVISQGNEVGTIVYELKKVAQFSNAHILQTRKAKQTREADYGLLVTNAKRTKTDAGFSTSQGVIIIHPAGALVLISILRDNLIEVSKLRLSKKERDKTIKAVLDYIQSPTFKNSLEDIILDTMDLYSSMKKEVVDHTRRWEYRIEKYRRIYGNAHRIESKAVRLLTTTDDKKSLPKSNAITPISLPKQIE